MSRKSRMRPLHSCWRWILYVWVSPGSAIGLCGALLAWGRGGRWQVVDGVLEVFGGGVTGLLSRWSAVPGKISAITLGHIVIGGTKEDLDRTRRHERVHVRQYERWGPLFIPAYLLASLWIWFRGGCPYFDNPFEIEAYASEDDDCAPPRRISQDDSRGATTEETENS